MNFINKLQNKPEREKKIILWSIIVFVAVVFIGLWLYVCSKNLKEFNESNVLEQINFPSIENAPKVKTPAMSDEVLKEAEKMIQELESQDAEQ